MKTERKPKGENKMIKNKRKHLSALYEHLDAYVHKKRNLPITENQAKKITEDSLGPFYNMLDDYILKKGNEIPPVIGIIFFRIGELMDASLCSMLQKIEQKKSWLTGTTKKRHY